MLIKKFKRINLQHAELLMETAEELESLSCICGFHVYQEQ